MIFISSYFVSSSNSWCWLALHSYLHESFFSRLMLKSWGWGVGWYLGKFNFMTSLGTTDLSQLILRMIHQDSYTLEFTLQHLYDDINMKGITSTSFRWSDKFLVQLRLTGTLCNCRMGSIRTSVQAPDSPGRSLGKFPTICVGIPPILYKASSNI